MPALWRPSHVVQRKDTTTHNEKGLVDVVASPDTARPTVSGTAVLLYDLFAFSMIPIAKKLAFRRRVTNARSTPLDLVTRLAMTRLIFTGKRLSVLTTKYS